MVRMHRIAATLAALLVGLALASPAGAGAGPPHKEYACYGEAGFYISVLKIKSDSKYSYLGKSGKYTYHPAGKNLKFTTGPLKPWIGRAFKYHGGPAIYMVTHQSGGVTMNCYA